jgi:hypothetical protein
LFRSELLTQIPHVVAGFTSREGGLSEGPFTSLNLGRMTTDQPAAVETNRRRLLEALGRTDAQLITLRQVHSATVVEVSHVASRNIEADGVWTRDRQAVIGVLVADCVPILLADKTGRAVAAVHAGWRGTRDKIAAVMVQRLAAAGFAPESLVAAIGPAIGPCCYGVGDDVAAEIKAALGDVPGGFAKTRAGQTSVDLWQQNRAILRAAGVPEPQIETLKVCVSCDRGFYSHRRDGSETGRQAGVIGFTP